MLTLRCAQRASRHLIAAIACASQPASESISTRYPATEPLSLAAWGTVAFKPVLQTAQYSKAAKKGGKKVATPPAASSSSTEDFDMGSTRQCMEHALQHLQKELSSIRTGRATAGMLDHLKVEVYGDSMPMKACGMATVRDPQLLVFNVFDPQTLHSVENAIRDSPLGLNPRVEGQDLLIPVPRPTAETLTALKRVCKTEGEQAKVTIRQCRKAALDEVKKVTAEDERFRLEKEVQEVTSSFVAQVDALVAAKEKSITQHTA
uniref:Ribosome-recycling factor, chloroplastic n=3 Tax=Auxenochlorella protothecoides TaxID=3075 RepID=A0A1D1ZPB5_AUXPR